MKRPRQVPAARVPAARVLAERVLAARVLAPRVSVPRLAIALVAPATVILSGCSVVGEAIRDQGPVSTAFAPVSAAAQTPGAQGTPVDPGQFGRTGNLFLLRAGGVATCGIGLNVATAQLGNLTCHMPPGAIPGVNPSTVDIDDTGVHAAAWPMWSGAIAELLPGQSVTVGVATCTASAGPRLRCQNPGGWVDIGATGTTVSMPPSPLTAQHGG
ncbi:hypothetical protein [Gordonia sp. NPDC003950]